MRILILLIDDIYLTGVISWRLNLIILIYISVQYLALVVFGNEQLHPFAPRDQHVQET